MNPLLKWVLKVLTGVHIFLYQRSGGRIGSKMRDFNVLLLTTTGRKTGKRRTLPLGYIRDGNNYVIIASNGGAAQHPVWYLNVKQDPKVEIQVGERILNVAASVAQGDNRQRLWSQLVKESPSYAAYEQRTSREIPLVMLTPNA